MKPHYLQWANTAPAPTLSLEGILDNFIAGLGKVFKDNRKAPGDEEFRGDSWDRSLSKDIRKTLGNAKWVAANFKEKQSVSETISRSLSLKGKIPLTPSQVVADHLRLHEAWFNQHLSSLRAYSKALLAIHASLEKADLEDAEAAFTAAAQALDAVQLPFPADTRTPEAHAGVYAHLKGGRYSEAINEKSQSKEALPALTAQQVVAGANQLVDMVEHVLEKSDDVSQLPCFHLDMDADVWSELDHGSQVQSRVAHALFDEGQPAAQRQMAEFFYWGTYPTARALAWWLRSAITVDA